MMSKFKGYGLLLLGLVAVAVPAKADNEGVSFDGNILWRNSAGSTTVAGQYSQTPAGALSQTTQQFVQANFSNNQVTDPLLDPTYASVQGVWRPQTSSPALFGNGAPVVKVSDVDPFFYDVPYAGALSSNPQADWTRGWIYTNLAGGQGRTDINAALPAVNVTTDITSNTTWSAGNNYFLNGRIGVTNGATLTIEPGVVIFGAAAGSYLVIERDGRINAVGSAYAPIIFTSAGDFTAGEQAPGDWGGVVIHGEAVANCAAGGVVAGCNLTSTGNDCESEGGAGFFGGSNDAHDSGILKFVRSEYAGQVISLNNELNAFTFNAVGTGTTVEYLQAHRGTDDLFEWFGGAVKCRYLVGTGGDDDGIDWQMGFRGRVQFAVIVATAADNANGDSGMECDNNEFNFSCPGESNGIVANVTLIGEPTLTGRGVHFRRGTNGGVFNSIITGWTNVGFQMEHAETHDNGVGAQPALYAPVSGGVSFDGNTLWANSAGATSVAAQYNQTLYGGQSTQSFVEGNFNNNRVTDPLLDASFASVQGVWRPQASSPLLYENNAPIMRVSDVDSFFQDVPFQGALDSEAGSDWTRNWIYTNLAGGFGRLDINPGLPAVNVTTDITGDTTWAAGSNYFLNGRIGVTNGATLTIEPGVVILGAAAGSYLVIERDGQINAIGTEDQPIIFTSSGDFTAGEQAPGDWGGVVIHGEAVANCAAGGVVAGCNLTSTGNDCESEGGAGFFGGSDDADNSGTLKYVRSEYAGQVISLNNELNAFTFNAVGTGTTVEYLQAHRGTDDLFEWFGGAVKCRYLVGTGGDDDGIDWQMGFRGRVQFAVIVATAADNANGDNGMECDNNEFDFNCPGESNGIVANLTLIGEPTVAGRGVHFRRGTNGGVFNSVIVGWTNVGFHMEHLETYDNGVGPRPTLYAPAVGVEEGLSSSAQFRAAFGPNPVVGNGQFMFSLPRQTDVQVRVFNARGRLVDTVFAGQLEAGPQVLSWTPRSQASGVYFYQVQAGGQVATGKLMIANN